MSDDEVLPAGLADDARVVAVRVDVAADVLPHRVEDGRRPGEVDPGQLGAGERCVADRRAGAVDEVDDAVGQARLLEQAHHVVGGERGRRGRLPEDGVSHQGRRRGQVAADRREVERRHGEDEALERAVLHPVPGAWRRVRLFLVDARHELDVEAPEVGQLAGGVDLRLVRRLRLAEHRRRVQGRPPRPREQLGRAKEDRRPLLPGHAVPVVAGLAGRCDRLFNLRGAAGVDVGENVIFSVRHHGLEGLTRLHVLAADHERDLDPLALELAQSLLQLGALRRARSVVLDGLVPGLRRQRDRGTAHLP